MAKQTIRLTESMLNEIIAETIQETMQDEGFIDKLNAFRKTAGNKGNGNIFQRMKKGAQNYSAQGRLDNAVELGKALKRYIREKDLPDSTPVSSILSGIFGSAGKEKQRMHKNGLPRA